MFTTVFNILGGIAIFVFGIKLMSDGLHKVAGARMRSILRLFSANRFVAIISGALVTTVIQSSATTTIMVIGFVNAGLLTLVQAIGIIFGANIGTTVTAQLVAFDISCIIMPTITLGLLLSFVSRKKVANWSEAIIGLGFIFLGMRHLENTLAALAGNESFMSFFQLFDCTPINGIVPLLPLLGAVGVGVVVTFVVQSSAACSGVIVALGAAKLIDIYTATALILGSNIGTTITAQIVAISANRIAKQAALAHLLFNLIGVLAALVSFYIWIGDEPVFFYLVDLISDTSLPRRIANSHTVFNVCTTLLLVPFIPLFAKICERVIPAGSDKIKYKTIDEHLLNTPSIALAQATAALHKMLKKAWTTVDCALRLYNRNDEKNQTLAKQLERRESDIDSRQEQITEYLANLMQKSLTKKEAAQIPQLLHCVNDAERIGDHTSTIRDIIEKVQQEEIRFSQEAEAEFNALHDQLASLVEKTTELLAEKSTETADEAADLYFDLQSKLVACENSHVSRINRGLCNPQSGIPYLELLEEIRKVSRHVRNIAERAEFFGGEIASVRGKL